MLTEQERIDADILAEKVRILSEKTAALAAARAKVDKEIIEALDIVLSRLDSLQETIYNGENYTNRK